jgi:magnesium-transporting ATPase (P-type)
LLLVHGRWSYRRVSKLILYCFYKNIVLYLTQFWFVFYNGFSGTSIHDRWTIGTYNLIFSALPIQVLAVLDQDVPARIAEKFPELYLQGQRNTFFNTKIFVGWILNAIYHSAISFYIPYYCLINAKYYDGQDVSMYGIGITIYTSVLFIITVKVCLETSSWTWVHALFYFGSVALWFAFVFAYGAFYYVYPIPVFPMSEFYEISGEYRILFTFQFWSTVLLTTVLASLRDVFWKFFKRETTRTFYYAIQAHGDKKSRETVMENFPFEDGVPLKIKSKIKSPVQTKKIKNIFRSLSKSKSKSNYRGFAFSQTESKNDLQNTFDANKN